MVGRSNRFKLSTADDKPHILLCDNLNLSYLFRYFLNLRNFSVLRKVPSVIFVIRAMVANPALAARRRATARSRPNIEGKRGQDRGQGIVATICSLFIKLNPQPRSLSNKNTHIYGVPLYTLYIYSTN